VSAVKKRGWPDAAAILEQVGRGVIDDRMVAAPDDTETAMLKKRARAAAQRGARAQQTKLGNRESTAAG
jgi:hypothetical protein